MGTYCSTYTGVQKEIFSQPRQYANEMQRDLNLGQSFHLSQDQLVVKFNNQEGKIAKKIDDDADSLSDPETEFLDLRSVKIVPPPSYHVDAGLEKKVPIVG